MATPKKKHLIDLMIEAGVKWSDGAEYAAQDKADNRVYFFFDKPKVSIKDERYHSPDGTAGGSRSLPSLCRNWHQTIVTREQYAEAVAEKLNVDEQPETAESQPCGAATPATIEQRIIELQAMERNLTELRAELHEMERNLDEFSDKLTDDLHALGITWLDGAIIADEPNQPVITNWRDLRVGDVIKVKGKFWEDDEEYTVTIQDGSRMPVFVGGYWADSSKDEFKFIRRP